MSRDDWEAVGYAPLTGERAIGFVQPILTQTGSNKHYIQIAWDDAFGTFSLLETQISREEIVFLKSAIACSPYRERIVGFSFPNGTVSVNHLSVLSAELGRYMVSADVDTSIRVQIAELLGDQVYASKMDQAFIQGLGDQLSAKVTYTRSVGASRLYTLCASSLRSNRDVHRDLGIINKACARLSDWNLDSLGDGLKASLLKVVSTSEESLRQQLAYFKAEATLSAVEAALGRKLWSARTPSEKAPESAIATGVALIARERSDGICTFEEARRVLPQMIDFSEYDLSPSPSQSGRSRWDQRLNNIKSNHKTGSNFVRQGLLKHIRRCGYQITQKGLDYLHELDL